MQKNVALLIPADARYYPHARRHVQVLLQKFDSVELICLGDSTHEAQQAVDAEGRFSERIRIHLAAPVLPAGFLGFLGLMVSFYKILRSLKPRWLEVLDPPCLIPAACYSMFAPARILYFSMEFFTETPSLSRRRFKRWIWYVAERWSVRRASMVMTVCDGVAERLKDRFRRTDVYVIRNLPEKFVPSAKVQPFSPERLRGKCGFAEEDYVLVYQGALRAGRGLETLCAWVKTTPGLALLIFGDGPLESLVSEYAQHSRICWQGRLPWAEMMAFSAGADAGLVWIEPLSESYRLSLPGKIFDYPQAGLPVLATPLPEISRYVHEYNLGVVCADFSCGAFAEAVNELKRRRADLQEGLRHRVKDLNWDQEGKRFVRLLDLWFQENVI